ncbi:putative ribonuclease H-like domain-containing protein [Tanacetum coccineum]
MKEGMGKEQKLNGCSIVILKRKIEEEVYVCQPTGFEDPHFPNKVYKVEKALYGLHQAPRAWYETLHKDDILLVQVYVDDIIFGSTKKEISIEFEKLMHDKFQMSSMGELSFFLGLQVKQKSDRIFIKARINIRRSKFTPKTSLLHAVNRIFRDSNEKKLIQVIKIHTDKNVANLLTKAFDVSSLVVPLRKVGDEAVHKELGDRMERAATTASSSKAEQDSCSGLRCQDTILGDVDAQTRFETTSEQSNDPPLSKLSQFEVGVGHMRILELMEIVHNCLHWHQLLQLVQVPAAEGDSINTSIKGFSFTFFILISSLNTL